MVFVAGFRPFCFLPARPVSISRALDLFALSRGQRKRGILRSKDILLLEHFHDFLWPIRYGRFDSGQCALSLRFWRSSGTACLVRCFFFFLLSLSLSTYLFSSRCCVFFLAARHAAAVRSELLLTRRRVSVWRIAIFAHT